MSLAGKNVVFVAALGSIAYEASKELMTLDLASFFAFDILDKPEAVKALQDINPNTKVHYTKFDITNKESIKSALADVVSKVQYIDVLVNGAGILADPAVELTINVNLIGLINTTFEALPYMDKNQMGRGGVIVNIASVLGLEPCPPAAVYCASKFGVVGFSRSLGHPDYYEHTGVAVSTFCPGLTDTPLKNNLSTKYTFDYSKAIGAKFDNSKTQTPEICGEHLAQVVDLQDNGGIYISNQGTLTKVKPSVYWEPTY
ncbi:alcohol dehydrogenase 1-like [Rhagoletis pomonella]|uniref:alcohol dehydrogenase 1-like n=1 Tax=Rhagoletis pomonella TaxID=28610 RepID=UPI00177C8206|nr:alcohol dehydrogenase 1-like [Rhagoletis pomonella]XP_036343353.1 alcohol dehydrogenase 1-like [Rhagoletis pomonella]